MTPRVVGNPQTGRIFGAKSREALTEREERRSGAWSPPPRTPSPPPEPVVPKVIYVPLPPAPHRSTDAMWAERLSALSDDARQLCGLPALARTNEPRLPWNPSAPPPEGAASAAPTDTTASDQSTESYQSLPPLPERHVSLWRRVVLALGCLGGR